MRGRWGGADGEHGGRRLRPPDAGPTLRGLGRDRRRRPCRRVADRVIWGRPHAGGVADAVAPRGAEGPVNRRFLSPTSPMQILVTRLFYMHSSTGVAVG